MNFLSPQKTCPIHPAGLPAGTLPGTWQAPNFFLAVMLGRRDLTPQPGMRPMPPALGAQPKPLSLQGSPSTPKHEPTASQGHRGHTRGCRAWAPSPLRWHGVLLSRPQQHRGLGVLPPAPKSGEAAPSSAAPRHLARPGHSCVGDHARGRPRARTHVLRGEHGACAQVPTLSSRTGRRQ